MLSAADTVRRSEWGVNTCTQVNLQLPGGNKASTKMSGAYGGQKHIGIVSPGHESMRLLRSHTRRLPKCENTADLSSVRPPGPEAGDGEQRESKQ